MINDILSFQSPMDYGHVISLAESIVERTQKQPIPLSKTETESLAIILLQTRERFRFVVRQLNLKVGNDDPIDGDRIPDYLEALSNLEKSESANKANERQIGGKHYGLSNFQHWDLVALFKLDYFQGQITKYVMRWKQKNGVQDLEKAQHFLEKYIELEKQGKLK